MKFIAACVTFMAVVALSKAATTSPTVEDHMRAMTENLDKAAKKFEEMSGFKISFDKEKFYNTLKTASNDLMKGYQTWEADLQKQGKVLPEEYRKKWEELVKEYQETVKNLNSPEFQQQTQKMKELINSSVKKMNEHMVDIVKFAFPESVQKSFNLLIEELKKVIQPLQEQVGKVYDGMKKPRQ